MSTGWTAIPTAKDQHPLETKSSISWCVEAMGVIQPDGEHLFGEE